MQDSPHWIGSSRGGLALKVFEPMSEPLHQEQIRAVLERNVKAVSLRPAIARHTARTLVRLKSGLECELEEGPWKMTIAMGEKSGGTDFNRAPDSLARGRNVTAGREFNGGL